jgi:hypothetical protein
MTDMERLGRKLAEAEAKLRTDTARLLGPREEQWRRVSALAGLDEDGSILPPTPPKKRKKADD